jgi:DNA-binding CsgD family transcriptional regulator
VATMRRSAARIEQLGVQGLDAAALRSEMLAQLRSAMSVDAAFFATVDPVTMLFTSAYADEPLAAATALFLENEYGQDDVNKFVELAEAPDPVASLDHLTRGRRADSVRYRDLLAPLGLGDEVRVALTAGGQCWGVLCLHRSEATAGFDEEELRFLAQVGPLMADGLRRAVTHGALSPATPTPLGPGIIVVGDDMGVRSMSLFAQHWLEEIADDERSRGLDLPVTVYAAVARAFASADAVDGAPVAARVRRATGGWIAVHASPMLGGDDRSVVVVLEAASPTEVSSLLLAAHGLTPAQSRVVALVLRGHSTRAIVDELHISSHTVQEHLHAVFDRLGIGSRRELVAALSGRPH